LGENSDNFIDNFIEEKPNLSNLTICKFTSAEYHILKIIRSGCHSGIFQGILELGVLDSSLRKFSSLSNITKAAI